MNQTARNRQTVNLGATRSLAPQALRTSAPACPQTPRIRVLVADDHPVVRKGIVACLSKSDHLEIIAEARDGDEALRLTRQLSPDILILDMDMPKLNGQDVIDRLRIERPRTKVLVLSANHTPEIVLRMLRAGANGYALKDSSADDLLLAVEKVQDGQMFFSPEVAHVALNQFVRKTSTGPNPNELSNREREILTHIAEGMSNKEIASRLHIGTRTVETHRERLMRKLEIHSVAGLTKFAIVNGFIAVPELAV